MSVHDIARDPIYEGLPDGGGLPNHRRIIKDFPGILDIVTVVFNPQRYRARYDLYRAFERQMLDAGVRLTTVEIAFGGRPFEVTIADNPRHLQLRTSSEMWLKENALNLGVERLPRDWEYVGFLDCDIAFVRHDWPQESLHQLQHYSIIQPFSQIAEVTDQYEQYDTGMGLLKQGFAACYQRSIAAGNVDEMLLPCIGLKQVPPGVTPTTKTIAGGNILRIAPGAIINSGNGWNGRIGQNPNKPPHPHKPPHPPNTHVNRAPHQSNPHNPPIPYYGVGIPPWGPGVYMHPGFAWIMRRSTYHELGGLIDWAIAGAGDHHMAWCLLGLGMESCHSKISVNYKNRIWNWQARALDSVRGNIGYATGTIIHHWHGPKAKRKYWERWDALLAGGYDPDVDIFRDPQGLYQLSKQNPKLRDALRSYFAQRSEDVPYIEQ